MEATQQETQPAGTQTPLQSSQRTSLRAISPLFYVAFILTVVVFMGLIGYVLLSMRNASLQQVKENSTRQYLPEPNTVSVTPMDETTIELSRQGSSDETLEIERDVSDTDLSGIDAEMSEIETNLSSE